LTSLLNAVKYSNQVKERASASVKERRQRERTEIRERILDAARGLRHRRRGKASRCGRSPTRSEYTPPVIYAFRDKDAIIEELCYRQLRTLAKAFANFATLDPVERLRRIGYVYVDFAVKHPSHFRFLFLMAHSYKTDDDELAKDDPQENAYAFLKQTATEGLAAAPFGPVHRRGGMPDVFGSAHGLVALQL
jgi:hypothetical protein